MGRLRGLLPREGRVAEIEDLGARLRRVRLEGPALGKLAPFVPGGELSIRPPEGWIRGGGRTYTGLSFDREAGRVELVAFLHGQGPATRMLAGLAPGDVVGVWGFDRHLTLLPDVPTHVVLGDESAVGAAASLARGTPPGSLIGAIETDPGDVEAVRAALARLQAPLDVVPRQATRGAALCDWLRARPADAATTSLPHYLLGHGQSVVALRKLVRERGTPESRIRARAFWVDGRG
jgi:ferric-chelate reductase (NADPH)